MYSLVIIAHIFPYYSKNVLTLELRIYSIIHCISIKSSHKKAKLSLNIQQLITNHSK